MMIAHTILRNPAGENKGMHALNGNGPKNTLGAKAKAAKGPTPRSVKIKVIAILECHQHLQAESAHHTLRQKSSERMTRTATRPSHLVFEEIKQRQADTTAQTHIPANSEERPETPPVKIDDADVTEYKNRRAKRAGQNTKNGAPTRTLLQKHWNLPILTEHRVRSSHGVATNSTDAKKLIRGAVLTEHTHNGLRGHAIQLPAPGGEGGSGEPNSVQKSLRNDTGKVDDGHIWQIGRAPVCSTLTPVPVSWDKETLPEVLAIDVRACAEPAVWETLSGVDISGTRQD